MNDDFIEVQEHALSVQDCRAMIQQFETSGQAVRGRTGGGVNTELKDSWDICISDYAEWSIASNLLNTAMMTALLRYVRKYPHVVLAPLSLQVPDPHSGKMRALDAQGANLLLAERPPSSLEWLAVNDRLRRSAAGAGLGNDSP